MSAHHFFDTNILLYSISRAADEAAKRERAIELLDQDGGGLSIQVLQEFYVQATRLTRPDPLPHEIAVGLIGTWMRFAVQDITASVLTLAYPTAIRAVGSNFPSMPPLRSMTSPQKQH